MKTKRALPLSMLFFLSLCCGGCNESGPIKIKALILPKFESGEMSGDFPGEAQYYYEGYLKGAKEYEISGGVSGNKLYVKDGVGLYLTGEGKVNCALSTNSVLTDSRFDFSKALILDTGCAGASKDYGVMGDVYLISATVDGDLGHRVDSTELSDPSQTTTWFYDAEFAEFASRKLDQRLTSKVYELIKDAKIETTETTRAWMSAAFDGADWAIRDPRVLLGTSYTCDNYWKGEVGHNNALLAVQQYGCPDPYAATEMEDHALALTLDRLGYLNHLVILRDAVNMDVFMNGATPESLWDPNYSDDLAQEDSLESADIFEVAMESNYKVGRIIIDAYCDGTLTLE